MSSDGIEPSSIQDDAAGEQSANVHITTILICSDNHIFIEYYECFFIAVWIIVAAEKDEARPHKKTGRAVHYNGSWSRCRTDRSKSCRQKIHKTIQMYCQGPHPDQLQALESLQSKRGTGYGNRKSKRMVLAGA